MKGSPTVFPAGPAWRDRQDEINAERERTDEVRREKEKDRTMEMEEIDDMEVIAETAKAILVRKEDSGAEGSEDGAVWVPKSVLGEDSEVSDGKDHKGPGKLVVARWFAEKEGLG